MAETPPGSTVKHILTKIDATKSTGLCIVVKANSLALLTVTGDPAATFPVDPSSLNITPAVTVQSKTVEHVRKYISAKQSWKLSDSSGEGALIENDNLRTLIILSEIDRTVYVTASGRRLTVPGHCFFLLNDPPQDAVLDFGVGRWIGTVGKYGEKLSAIAAPTLVEISPNSDGIVNGFPTVTEGTIIDSTMEIHGK